MLHSIFKSRSTIVFASTAVLWAICSVTAHAVPLETLSNYAANIRIGEGIVYPDGTTSSFNDWSGVTAYQNNTHPNALVQSIAIANDSQYYYFKYTFNGKYNVNEIPAALNLYLDIDSSTTSGQKNWWGSSELGTDLLVQGAFVYSGPGGSVVAALGGSLFPFAEADGMEFAIDRKYIDGDKGQNGNAFNFQFLEQDRSWAIADIYPYCKVGTGGNTGTACDTTTNPVVDWAPPGTEPGIQPYFRYVAAGEPAASVPEPGTLGLLGITLVGIGFSVARRRWNSNLAR